MQSIDRVVALLREVGGLGDSLAFERSFKTRPGQLSTGRFLLGVERRGGGRERDEAIGCTCARIGMPPDFLRLLQQNLTDANHVYFGVENDGGCLLLKVYLEYRDKIEAEIRSAPTPAPGRIYELFSGYKWDAENPSRCATTRYAWHPLLSVSVILAQVRNILGPASHAVAHGVMAGLLEHSLRHVSPENLQYLEVSEEGNERRSFDINLYKAGHLVRDIEAPLRQLLQHHGVDRARFDALFDRIRPERFGHLAGGVDRDGRSFMTVYYGVRSVQGRQLQQAAIAPAAH